MLAPAHRPARVAPIVYTSASPPPVPGPAALAGRRVLLALAPEGHVVQETLIPAAILADLGAEVIVATTGAASIRFDPLCNALALAEAPRFAALRLLAQGCPELQDPLDLRRLDAAGGLDALLASVDAVLLPGGHGKIFADFAVDPLVGRALSAVHARGGVVGLMCHAVVAGALATGADGRPLIADHAVTCWPARLEALFGKIPGFGRYLAPFAGLVEETVAAAAGQVHTRELPLAVVHDRIVTGWGPWTAEPFARALAHSIGQTPSLAPRAVVGRVAVERGSSFTNWGGTFSCRPDVLAHPETVAQVAAVVERAAREGRRVRPVGAGYSYTRLVETDDVMLSLDRLTGLESYDADRGVVRVRAGTPLWALWPELAKLGVALAGAGDIDRQTVGGMISTATHGTGRSHGSFSSFVRGITLVDGEGRVHHVTDAETLRFAACSLGSFGVATHVDLAVVPRYHLQVHRWGASVRGLLDRLPELVSEHRNFEMFWFPGTDTASCKSMDLCDPAAGASGLGRWFNEMVIENGLGWAASEAVNAFPPIRRVLEAAAPYLVADETTVRPAEDAYATPRLVKHQEIEYALPIEAAGAAIRALEEMLLADPAKTVFPFEIRFAPGEDIPLSPAYRRDTAWIAAHTYVKEDHRAYFARCEAIFRSLGGRPHWGKLHGLGREEIASLYPELPAFQAVRDRFDPRRRFGNGYLERVIGA
jgi:FAD-linked oxidoreductase